MIIPDDHTKEALERMEKLKYEGYEWKLKRSIKPRRCAVTKAKIPCLTVAYRGQKFMDIGEQTFISETWISAQSFILLKLKGILE